MGTRHLIVAVKDGQTKLAQYGQWDGYPSGQGIDVLKFVSSKARLAKLSKQLDKIEFLTQEQLDAEYAKIGVAKDAYGLNQNTRLEAGQNCSTTQTGRRSTELHILMPRLRLSVPASV